MQLSKLQTSPELSVPASFQNFVARAPSNLPFAEIWLVDFEFNANPGDNPEPVCLVAHELRSQRTIKLWRDEMGAAPPYSIDEHSLFVAYYSSAEFGCHLALGWPLPQRVLDLYTEFRNLTNGSVVPNGASLLSSLTYFGLDGISSIEKSEMRELIMRGGPWSDSQRTAILEYCASDVWALRQLLTAIEPRLDLPRALLRGRYMAAVACMENVGIPIDTEMHSALNSAWDSIQDKLVRAVDKDFGVYDGVSFRADRFERFLESRAIAWPRLESGRIDLKDETFRDMSRAHPQLGSLHQLRSSLSKMRLSDLSIGKDGRNRTLLSPLRSKTGRNQPSNTRFAFGPAVWLRGLIKSAPGLGLAYIDYKQQEFGIAAALSGDAKMQAAYASGDPYLAFAKQAGAAPQNATKQSHKSVREQFKACVLAVQYGMGPESLAIRIGKPPIVARELLALHRQTYSVFWDWSDQVVTQAMLTGSLQTVFGWRLRIEAAANERSLRNFPMQANGAEMLRLACCVGTEAGIRVCAPIHDAVLIEAPVQLLERAIDDMQAAMSEASKLVLDGFELGTDVSRFEYPDRYQDERGKPMWNQVMGILSLPPSSMLASASR